MSKCYGGWMGESCEEGNRCESETACNQKHNLAKGSCTCEYKKSCHVPRQQVRMFQPERACNFYEWFEEDKRSKT